MTHDGSQPQRLAADCGLEQRGALLVGLHLLPIQHLERTLQRLSLHAGGGGGGGGGGGMFIQS